MRPIRLQPADAAAYRDLMLEAYAREPDAFTSTAAEREPLPLAWWARRVSASPEATEQVFGTFEGEVLTGVAGLRFAQRTRTRHKATLFGMVVRPEHRGKGLARLLVEAVIEAAAADASIRLVQLTVTETNDAARQLYTSCGFCAFGTEPLAIRVESGFVAKVHMWRPIGDASE